MVTITESAKLYLKKVGQPNVYLSVKGGGCSGFTYVWEMSDAEPTIENLVVDEMAEMFVLGCTIDYKGELNATS